MAEQFGLADAFGDRPEDPEEEMKRQLNIGKPKTPAEAAERKSQWSQIFEKIGQDPSLQRALMLAGVSMMQPLAPGQTTGGKIGEGLGVGLAAYESGEAARAQQAQAGREEERAMRREGRLDRQESRLDVNLTQQSQRHALEIQQAQAAIDAIPDEREKRRLALELQKIDVSMSPKERQARINQLNASAEAARKGGVAAARQTDQERAIADYIALPEIQALPESQRRAAATQQYIRDARGVPGVQRAEAVEQEASALYNYFQGLDEGERNFQLMMANEKTKAMYAQGAALAGRGTGAATPAPVVAPSATPAPKAAAPRVPISAAEIEKRMRENAERAARTSTGQIR